MQVARSQAARALDAVRRRRRHALRHTGGHGSRPRALRSDRVTRRARTRAAVAIGQPHPAHPLHTVSPLLIDRVLHAIDDLPPLRVELVAAASARLAAGERPSAEAIADMAIRRAAVDQLR